MLLCDFRGEFRCLSRPSNGEEGGREGGREERKRGKEGRRGVILGWGYFCRVPWSSAGPGATKNDATVALSRCKKGCLSCLMCGGLCKAGQHDPWVGSRKGS